MIISALQSLLKAMAPAAKNTRRDRLRQAALAALATRVELRDEEEPDLGAALDEILETLKKN